MNDGLASNLNAAIAQIFPALLLTYWTLAAGSVITTILPIPVPRAFKDAVRLSACRGKTWDQKPAALGRLKDWSVPQSWFLHFYLLGSVCNALILAVYCAGLGSWNTKNHDQVSALLCLLLFEIHLLRRALETGLMMRYNTSARMHGIAYLFGMSYYLFVPLSLLPSAWYQQQQQQQQWLSMDYHSIGSLSGTLQQLPGRIRTAVQAASVLQLVGVLVFLGGNLIQFDSHRRLALLARHNGRRNSDKLDYKIPRGGLFEYVSSPHYLAEIVIYLGLAVVNHGGLLTLMILTWVAVNLSLAADETHRWYHHRFKKYPANRRALLPFVW